MKCNTNNHKDKEKNDKILSGLIFSGKDADLIARDGKGKDIKLSLKEEKDKSLSGDELISIDENKDDDMDDPTQSDEELSKIMNRYLVCMCACFHFLCLCVCYLTVLNTFCSYNKDRVLLSTDTWERSVFKVLFEKKKYI